MTAPFTFSLRLNNNHPASDYVRLAQAAEASGFDQIWVSNDLFLRSSPVIRFSRERPPRSKALAFAVSKDAYLRFGAPRVTPIYVGALGPRMLPLAGELADGVLPLLLPPEHYYVVKPLIESGTERRASALPSLDFACCIWVSLSSDRGAARRALAEKVAYYGAQLSPLILSRLSLTREDLAIIERVVVSERDLARVASLVDERMMRLGVVGRPEDVIERLEPLAGAGARHLSFGPPLGPDPFEVIDLLGRRVLPHFRA